MGLLARAIVLTSILLLPIGARGADLPWKGPAFSWDAAAGLKAAQALPERESDDEEGVPIDVLLRDVRYSFDAQGRMTEVARLVYRARTSAGASYWSNVEANWNPSREARPEVRARVITPEGEVHFLDPQTFGEGSGSRPDSEMFFDVRTLRAPLPAMSAGVLVEEEYTTRETEAAFSAGVVNRYVLDTGRSAARHTHVHIEAPLSLPLRHAVVGTDLVARVHQQHGLQTIDLDADALPPGTTEPLPPHDVPPGPELVFSTGASWKDIAAAYAKVVDERVASAKVAARAKEWAGDAKDRAEIIRRLLAGLHRMLRYTALELGPNALLPHAPDEVLDRKYGDCKDMSTLMVALLKAMGIPARVALLRPNWDEVIPSLPGITAFTHAIVYVPGTDPLWIDPTDYNAPVGLLPVPDQGRLALIASPHTRDLTHTPEAQSSDNVETVIRDIFLSEDGPSRAVQTIEATGGTADAYRAALRENGVKRARHRYLDYFKEVLDGTDVGRFESSDPDDVNAPFRFRIEVKDSRHGFTSEKEAAVDIDTRVLLADLPDALKGGEDDKHRTSDLLLPMPYQITLRYLIHPPSGYALHPLEERPTLHLGPFALTRQIDVAASGEVQIDYRLDANQRRLTPDEVDEVRHGVAAFGDESFRVTFDQKGWALARDGRLREAIGEYNRLTAEHPKEALHHAQLALVLVNASAGEAARAEAARAVELEPESIFAWQRLGYVREHDLIGRFHRQGFDRAGAIAAWRKAVQLDPKDAAAHESLADLLSIDEHGVDYGAGAQLKEAADEYRLLHEELKNTDRDLRWAECLIRLRRFKEIVDMASSLEDTVGVYSKVLVARTLVEGTEAAIRNAQHHVGDEEQRQRVLRRAAAELLEEREYVDASALLTEALRGTPPSAPERQLARMYAETRRFESFPLLPDDPATPVWQSLQGIFGDGADKAGAVDPLSDNLQRLRLRAPGEFPPAAVLDVLRSHAQVATEGNPEVGCRVSLKLLVPGSNERPFRAYVVQEPGGLRVVATDAEPGRLGERALELMNAGNLKAARQWLDWATEIPLVERDSLITAHWARTGPRDADAVRTTAALLAGRSEHAHRVVPELEALRHSEKDTETARMIGLEVAYAYLEDKQYAQALEVVRSLVPPQRVPDDLFELRDMALYSLKRSAERRTLAEERLRDNPHDELGLRVLVSAASDTGDFDAAERAGRQAISQGDERAPQYYNELAWIALCRGAVTDQAIDDAQKSVAMLDPDRVEESRRWRAAEHTLASLYAEVGRVAEARQAILSSVDAAGGEPGADDWYVFGRLYEQYGLKQDALTAYHRVSMSEVKVPVSTAFVTRRRLDVLRGLAQNR